MTTDTRNIIRPVSQAAQWVEKINSDDVSLDEMTLFQKWIDEDPQNEKDYADCCRIWAIGGNVDYWSDYYGSEINSFREDAQDRSFLSSLKSPDRNGNIWKYAVAASIMIVFSLFFIQTMDNLGQSYVTRTGEQRIVTLEDGSKIHLNTATELSVNYSDDKRRITLLTGEALFDVESDPDRPFEVMAGPGIVRAVGTVFIVRAEAEHVIVTVSEGKVEIVQDSFLIGRAKNKIPKLGVGERLYYGKEGILSAIKTVDHHTSSLWLQGKINFSGLSLSEAFSEMNRYSTKKLIVGDESLNRFLISGIFQIGDINSFVKGLEEIFPIKAIMSPEKIIFVSRNDQE